MNRLHYLVYALVGLALIVGSQAIPASAAGSTITLPYGRVAVLTGLGDGITHSLVAYDNGRSTDLSPIIAYGRYMDTDDIQLEMTPAGENSWTGDILDRDGAVASTVTASYDKSGGVTMTVSTGYLETDHNYEARTARPG